MQNQFNKNSIIAVIFLILLIFSILNFSGVGQNVAFAITKAQFLNKDSKITLLNFLYIPSKAKIYYNYIDYQSVESGKATSTPTIKPQQIKPELNTYGDVHVVSAYSGSCNGQYSKNNEMCDANVYVDVKNTPITLFLNSYEPVRWHLKTSAGVNLKKIIICGYYNPDISDIKSKAEKQVIHKYYELSDEYQGNLISSYEKIQELTGKKPTSFQYKYLGDKFLVDGKSSKSVNDYPALPKSMGDVHFICSTQSARELSNCKFSKDMLTAYYSKNNSYLVNRYYSTGKYYFEAKLYTNFWQFNPSRFTDIGIVSVNPTTGWGWLKAPPTEDFGLSYTCNLSEKIRGNNIVGVAMDFDNGKLYCSVNGNWIDGNPLNNYGGQDIQKSRNYYAAVSINNPDGQSSGLESWTANFGRKPFKYQIPNGYSAYGSN